MLDNLKRRSFEVLTPQAASAELYFLLDGPRGMRVQRVAVDRRLQDSIADRFIGAAYLKIAEPEADCLLDVTAADDRSNVIYRYDMVADVPASLGAMSRALQGGDGSFDAADSLSELEAIIVVLGTAANKLVVYQHHYPISLIKTGSSLNIFRPGAADRFSEVESEIVKVGTNIHFVMLDAEIYVLDIKVLERLYGFQAAMRNVAQGAMNSIAASNIIVDSSFLEGRSTELPFLRKLAQVTRKSPVLGVISNAEIIRFVSGHPSLSRRLKVDATGARFVLSSKASQNTFLELLSDNFLRSELTQKHYETRAKDDVGIA